MKTLFTIFIVVCSQYLIGQTTIWGKVTDKKGEPLTGVNVYLKGSYDGGSTDTLGFYRCTTRLEGEQVLAASFIGFETLEQPVNLNLNKLTFDFSMKESYNELDAVVITAGSFEASDEKKSVILKPLDIVTTAGGLADIPSAINTLPGTQVVGEEGKLFVRGGDSYETRTFIDGMIVDKPYESTMPDVPSRGRFSPFLFKGTIFSSGGYSAEYGQALSSALILQTNDLPTESVTGLSLMSVGLGASHTQLWNKSSISVSADYLNLSPYFALLKQDFDWQEAPKGFGGSLAFRQKTDKDGMIKVYGQAGSGKSELNYPGYGDVTTTNNVSLTDNNTYLNATYRDGHGEKLISNAGVAWSQNRDDMDISGEQIRETTKSLQVRYNLTYLLNDNFKVKFGGDAWTRNFVQDYHNSQNIINASNGLNDLISAGFAETEFNLANKFAARAGVRAEYSSLINKMNVAPRISLAYNTGKKSQVSFAYGEFYQSPGDYYVIFNKNLDYEAARHFILNYQIIKNNRTFRIEGYYKQYRNLVKFDSLYLPVESTYNNDGNGYARGIDIFWRDRSFASHDYWISYSYIDTKRNYKDYPVAAMPTFVSNHNLSVVYKYYISKITSQIGFTYRFASGRPYYNPANPDFLSDRTKAYNDLSFNISYLTELWDNFTIVYFSVSNIPGFDNVFGYRYSLSPDSNGNYNSYAITPGATRFVFLGVFISLQGKSKKEV
ncbi:MAG: TonB-dependent receptor [Bacteroidales bacterium]|nr:TonB-dependent receptor [Bacteroidales bacterium]